MPPWKAEPASYAYHDERRLTEDPIGLIQAWVEQGTAPDELVASDANQATAGRTRPVCFYPAWPKYNGIGDLNAAASFSCVME